MNHNRSLWSGVSGLSLLLVIVLLTVTVPLQAAPTAELADPVEVETFLDGVMAAHLESFNIPGATLVVVRDGQLLLAKGFGYANLEQRQPVDPARTLFRPGSVAKLFTWTAVMQQVEQGRLDLHTDVNEYLDFAIPATFPEPITLHHLLTHTPGFEDMGQGLFVLSPEELISLEAYLKGNQPARVYPPGQVGAYSNYGAALAGYIVERVSGEPFHAYLENYIFAPLGMDRSTFRQPLPPALAPDMATGYGYANGAYVAGSFEYVSAYPAGSMTAPATDLAPFMIAHLQHGRYGDTRILQEATVEMMRQQRYTPDPRLSGMAYGFMEMRVNGRRILHHGGDTFLFHSGLYLLPEENVGLYVAYNGAGGSQARNQLLQAVMDRYYAAPPPVAQPPPPGSAERIAGYSGQYHLARANFTTPEKVVRLLQTAQVRATAEGGAIVSIFGQAEPYVEIEPGVLRHQARDERLVFHTDDTGQIWLYPDGAAPFAFFKAPWYATSSFTMLLLVGGLLFFLLSLPGWLIVYMATRNDGVTQPRLARAARWLATLFFLVCLIFVIAFLGVMTDVDPAYGVPRAFFGLPPIMNVILLLPILLALLVLGMAAFTVMAWRGAGNDRRPYWTLPGRLHYTLLTLTALALIWLMWYWNLRP